MTHGLPFIGASYRLLVTVKDANLNPRSDPLSKCPHRPIAPLDSALLKILMNTDIRADMRQMRNWLIGLYGIVVFGFIGSLFLTIIKSTVP